MELIAWSPGMTLEEIEKHAILKAFKHYHQNKTATANALGIAVRTLDAKLAKYSEEDAKEKQREEDTKRDREFQLQRARGIHPAQHGHDTASSNASTRVFMEPAAKISAKQ